MIMRTFSRYVAWRFCAAFLAVFLGIFLLVILTNYIELSRRSASLPHVTAATLAVIAVYRVPQVTELLLPFTIQIGAMAAFLNLSRRNELVIARAAGISAWQFVTPAVLAAMALGVVAATLYNPVAAYMTEQAKQLEEGVFGRHSAERSGFWLRQRGGEGQSILYASSSRDQGVTLAGVTAFTFDGDGAFIGRIEAASARLETGHWQLQNARVYSTNGPPRDAASYALPTNLTGTQIRESLATPETVPFWQLPAYIDLAEQAGLVAAGYRVQFQLLLARPFLFAAVVLLAAAVSLRFFRFGGVFRMVLSGVAAGFLLYVLAKVTQDLSKAQLMHAVTAAWLPAGAGALTGTLALLFQEDG
ncbi:MAG TPA: LPS export ABC transporter permease LptG [Xanthobacteraceae bacterium]|nr:LPS export ABC transporter permease LptG [Xanthobacteraceae bacterium]